MGFLTKGVVGLCILGSVIGSMEAQEHVTYDSVNSCFVDSIGGVDESLLNELDPFVQYGTIPGAMEKIQLYDRSERNIHFKKASMLRVYDDLVLMVNAIEKNFNIIKRIDRKNIKKLDNYERSLKGLINNLTWLQKHEDNELLRVMESYANINATLRQYSEEKTYTRNIMYLAKHRRGDCTEYTAAHYALLNYVGIDTYFKVGEMYIEDSLIGDHAWIHIKLKDGKEFDMDPRSMAKAIPMEVRNAEAIKAEQVRGVHEYHK